MIYVVYIGIILVGICLIGIILHLLVKKKLNESNAVLWIFIGLLVVLSGIFPRVVQRLSTFFLITYPPAFVFTIAIIILLFIVLQNTIINSELTAKVQEAATEISILKQELDEYKKEMEQRLITEESGREE